MKVSIFTATHNPIYLLDVYESIRKQKFDEWVIVYNHGAQSPFTFSDPRIIELTVDAPANGVGFYKRTAADRCTGDILIELDHDDLLMPDAVDTIRSAFESMPEVGFVYSNALYTDLEWGKRPRFNSMHGWVYREVEHNSHILEEPLSFPPTPSNVARIWYAPDHVRAFRKIVYEKAGGYDPELFILDDQDLMCRLYLHTKFFHINRPLYIYRVHDDNTWLEHNKAIQDGVMPMYHKYIEQMMLKWSKDQGLLALDLGGRINTDKRYQSVDICNADINTDLNTTWPFKDESVGLIRAYDIFEHLKIPLLTMRELYRVLAPGGYALIQVPSTDGRGAFQDPTHVSFWNENSFLYYTHKQWARYVEPQVRFQVLYMETTPKDNNGVCWVQVHLLKLKGTRDEQRVPGIINI
jgi:glycosyltransferase involved in cell wall biosynthesis